ncbi:unnamed protein product [Peniophora sp. CBMAI 1063]|nr:unnamed protein product [Peniophora sp. CBMAI 1063]
MFSAIFAKLHPISGAFGLTQRNGVFLSSAKNEWAVGRGSSLDAPPDVWIDHSRRNTSSTHAIVIWHPESHSAVLKDCDSRNGSYVNGCRVPPGQCVELKDGDRVWLGPVDDSLSCGFSYQYLWGSYNPFLSEYGCEAKLGSGSFGDVYKFFRRSRPSEVYAVKVLDYSVSGGRNSYNDAITEMNLSRKARTHPNICAVIEAFQDDEHETLYLLMPYMPLGDLTQHFADHTGIGILRLRIAIKQLCDALGHIHSYGITHRDVKPANILVKCWSPLVFALADFGASYETKDDENSEMHSLIGSFSYMAPEVGNSTGYTNKVDSYSIGATGLHLLVGLRHNLFDDSGVFFSISALREWFDSRKIRWELAESRGLPPDGYRLLEGLLDSDPENRWSMAQVATFPWIRDVQDVDECELKIEPTVDLKLGVASSAVESPLVVEPLDATRLSQGRVSRLAFLPSNTAIRSVTVKSTYATALSCPSLSGPSPKSRSANRDHVPPVRDGVRRSPRQQADQYIQQARERAEQRADAEARFFGMGKAKAPKGKGKQAKKRAA